MPDKFAPSEFGGKVGRNRIQPPPHPPTAAEKLMLVYTAGDETGATSPDTEGVIWEGLLPREEQEALARQQGLLEKGQYDPRNNLT